MGQYIDKGTMVRIRTTNGADCIVKLVEDYDPTRIGTYVEMILYPSCRAHEFYMAASRIKSIEVSNTYWTPPLKSDEIENIRGRVAQSRSVM
jgi:hypothetical protein